MTASKKKSASKKSAAKKVAAAHQTPPAAQPSPPPEPQDQHKGRPREVRLNEGAEITDEGHVILRALNRKTVSGITYLETNSRLLRLPNGCVCFMRLDEAWVARGIRLLEQVVTDECIISMLVASEIGVVVQEGERVGVMVPIASSKVVLKRGESGG